MPEFWDIPKEEELIYSGHDWVLNVLANQKEDTRSQLHFIWWRAWHLKMEIKNGIGKGNVKLTNKSLRRISQ
jgi:hypothetical protein